MTRDLYVSAFEPQLGSGRALRTYTCIRALAMLGPVDLAYVLLSGEDPSPEYLGIDDLAFHPISPSRGLRRAAAYAQARVHAVPNSCARAVSPELISEGMRLALEPKRGRVVAGDPSAATALLDVARQRPVIYNSHNVGPANFGVTEPRFAISATATQIHERRLLRAAAESWMVSRNDMKAAHKMVPEAHLRYVPNAVDVAAIHPVNSAAAPGALLLMVADFHYAPNRVGRDWLVEEILPRVWRDLPDARLLLVGRGSREWPPADPRIETAGFVDDLESVYEQAACVVVPVTTGGGTPLKFVEALAYQVPIVATGFAARGLDAVAGEHYLRGDDAESFAHAIVGVLREGASTLAAAGRRLAEAEYSVQALAERIAA